MKRLSRIFWIALDFTDRNQTERWVSNLMVLNVHSDRLKEAYRLAELFSESQGRSCLLDSDVVYAVIARPRSLIGLVCASLGLSSDVVKDGILNRSYPATPYLKECVEKIAVKYFSRHPGFLEMVQPEHLLFVLSKTRGFQEFLEKLNIDSITFVSEMYRKSGKDIFDFPKEWGELKGEREQEG